MGFNLEFRKISSRQQSSSKTTKEDKLKAKTVADPPSSGPTHKTHQAADRKSQNKEILKESGTRSDELVRHMSNLPNYLRRTDTGENLRGKALNVGVLDWTRLEKWKDKQTHFPAFASNFSSLNISESSSSSRTATKASVSASCNKKRAIQQGFLSSSVKASCQEGLQSVKQSFQNVKQSQHSGTETKSIKNEQIITPSAVDSSGRRHSELSSGKEKRKKSDKITSSVGDFTSNVRHHGISQVPIRKTNCTAEESMKGCQDNNLKKKDKIHETSVGLTSSKSNGKGASLHSENKMNASNSETKKVVEQLRESDIDFHHKLNQSKPSNTALLHPRETAQLSSPQVFRLSQLRMSFDENLTESSQSRSSDASLLGEVNSEDVYSENSKSCAVHSVAQPASTSEGMQHRINTDQSSVVSKTPDCLNKMYNLQPEGAYSEKDSVEIKLRNQCAFRNSSESQDQETAELVAHRGRNPSPNRRFSFSLGRIGRSFSFKEGYSLPQFGSTHVSVKSGPVTSEPSTHLDNSSKEKAYSHSRTRSSPLRRLLDPILKHKALENELDSVKGRSDSIRFRTISVNESLCAEKSDGLSTQALLQLTIKNGLPLFKFVLNNERQILAATIKNLASPEKGDSGLCFTFYLVNEIKKKSGGWMSHGSKEKSCGYVYNVVGQMKSLNSKISKPSNQNPKGQHMVKEYVLLGAEKIGQKVQVPPKFIHSQELAAAVVEIPCKNTSQEEAESDDNNNFLKKGCLKCLEEDRCTCSSGENDVSGSRTTFILPGGVHGSPNKGEPTPLINRWKSGGLCDCEGWDIGCKLLVLSNHKERSNTSKSSKSHMGHFQLFAQEGAEQDKPLFTLMPLKDGLYSVEFSSSITHLQAFFISVSLLSCQKPSSWETNNTITMHEEITKEPSSMKYGGLQGKSPVKYTPIPPLSPVGRV